MNRIPCTLLPGLILALLFLIAGPSAAQWELALEEPISAGPDHDDYLGRSNLALDDQNTLHLVYSRRDASGVYSLLYTTKPLGQPWSAPEAVGSSGSSQEIPSLAVIPAGGQPYIAYSQGGRLKLARRDQGSWIIQELSAPGVQDLHEIMMEVDVLGRAHLVLALTYSDENKIGYGYWDPGTQDFHFQVIEDAFVSEFGIGAAPDIALKANGGVVIAYRGVAQYFAVWTAENQSLGGTEWTFDRIEHDEYPCEDPYLVMTPEGDLHLAYFACLGPFFPGRIFYCVKPAGAAYWTAPELATGTVNCGSGKLAVGPDGSAHILVEENGGTMYTGRIIYATNLSGEWVTQVLLDGDKYNPALVMDDCGNGSLVYQHLVGVWSHDVYYYGYVQGPSGITRPEIPAVPPTARLAGAYPNPFNPTTAVSFDLRAASRVSLRVYDTAGREVAALVDGWRAAGEHQATFDASGLPSGIYFAKLQAGDFTEVQKLVLLK